MLTPTLQTPTPPEGVPPTQQATVVTPPEPITPTVTTPAVEPSDDKKDKEYWENKTKDTVKEAQGLRERIRNFEKAEEERKLAAMSEMDRLKAEKEAAEKKAVEANEIARRAKIEAAAATKGFRNPALVVNLITIDKVKTDFSNVDTLLDELAKNEPYLVGKADSGLPRGTAPEPGGSLSETLDKDKTNRLKKMFPIVDRLIFPNQQ